MRKIGIIHGSDSDLPQMLEGLQYLQRQVNVGLIEVIWVDSTSQHRHTLTVQQNLKYYHESPEEFQPDVLIVGAGMANHLTGCVDAFLRYTLKNNRIVVFGVAFDDRKDPENTLIAANSILRVPGTQVVFKGAGSGGFLIACIDAVKEELPTITLKPAPESYRRDLRSAITVAAKKFQDQLAIK